MTMRKYIVADLENNYHKTDTMEEAKKIAEEWAGDAVEEGMDVLTGIYKLTDLFDVKTTYILSHKKVK